MEISVPPPPFGVLPDVGVALNQLPPLWVLLVAVNGIDFPPELTRIP